MSMNVLVSVNSKYIIPLKTLLFSLSKTQSERVIVYFLNLSLSESEINDLFKFCSYIGLCFNSINIPLEIKYVIKDKEALLPNNLSCETYTRLFSPMLLSNIDRVLWLDADCLVQNDLKEFYNQDLQDKAISACDHCNWILPEVPKFSYWEYPKRKRHPEHFNAGVILFNLNTCRNMKEFTLKSMKNIVKNSNLENAPLQDQSILNQIFLVNNIKWENPLIYNIFVNRDWDSGFLSNDSWQYDLYENASVIHYCSKIKPWNLLEPQDPIIRGYWIKSYLEVLAIEKNIIN